MCHTFTLLDAGYFCIVYLWAFFCDAIKLFGNTLVHSGFALLGRTRTVLSLIGISFSATEARPFCILYSMSHESWRFLVWLVEVAGKPYEHRAALIFSGRSFLTCEQFPPHMLWSYLEEYCRGRLWEFPEFSLCADLTSTSSCGCSSYLSLPGHFALSPQLSLPASTWGSPPCTETCKFSPGSKLG